jgi:hypothetical protein
MSDLRLGTILKCAGVSALAVALVACGNGTSGNTTLPLTTSALSGSYVFTAAGTDASDGDYSVAGSFVADGKGNITSAVADYNLGSGIDDNVALTGTYTVSGGTIAVTLMDGGSVKDTFTTAPVSSAGTAGVSNFDGTGSGKLYAQVTSGYTTPGTYSFSLSGEGDGTVSGSGQFVAGATGAFTSGNMTLSYSQTSLSYPALAGVISPPSTSGRGYANIAGNNLAYYVIGPNQIQMIGLDERYLLTIPAQKM